MLKKRYLNAAASLKVVSYGITNALKRLLMMSSLTSTLDPGIIIWKLQAILMANENSLGSYDPARWSPKPCCFY